MTEAARDIYQAHLDMVSNAVWNGDWETVADAVIYPHRMTTLDTVRVVADRDEIKATVQAFIAHLKGLGATSYHRILDRADFVGPDQQRIEGEHHVFVMHGGTYVIDPYPSAMTLVRQGGVWLGAGVRVPVENSEIDKRTTGQQDPSE